jgi:hypothetical protein
MEFSPGPFLAIPSLDLVASLRKIAFKQQLCTPMSVLFVLCPLEIVLLVLFLMPIVAHPKSTRSRGWVEIGPPARIEVRPARYSSLHISRI